ncbi:cellulose binding domain-containing protein [Actinoplanes sp. HUAS TT8]|uniref:cellulose binding domain-containing protein n=1 Tax=Actinoplanes sp. HUAS TT8 TaxID=3447453 RepID=UPI003F51B5DA
MNDTGTRRRRSLSVVVLDGMLRLYSAMQSGPTPTPKVREPGRRRGFGRWALIVAAVAALGGTALLVVVLARGGGNPAAPPDPAAALPGPPSPPAAAQASPVVSVRTSTSAASSLGPAATATRSFASAPVTSRSVPVTEATTVPLTASYGTSSVTGGLLGYKMTVTIANPGATAKDGWALAVTLPRSTLRVTSVTGATATQDGSTWTFAPDATTGQVAAGGSVVVTFGVSGATLIDAAPQSCTIDGNPCA